MGKKPQSSKSYEELRRIWYKKLERKGFVDIERNEYDLKSTHDSYRWSHMDSRGKYTLGQAQIQWAAKQEYYYLANQFLHSYNFESLRERNIWEYHSNGMGVRAIADTLNKLPSRKKLGRDTVWRIIRKLSKIMKAMYVKS